MPGVNAKGACIGPMGARVRGVMSELNGEKIDIIDWSDDPATFVGNALSPSKVVSVTVVDATSRTARVVVPDFQLSLAIGKEGQNARLAARLTGWRIDIRSDADPRSASGAPESESALSERASERSALSEPCERKSAPRPPDVSEPRSRAENAGTLRYTRARPTTWAQPPLVRHRSGRVLAAARGRRPTVCCGSSRCTGP